ncbi:MAG: fumarylacetoacetate hydrolase family protein [Syntrophorhabdales bacterium]|jgi:2-keto-4-pentenoate hydratase/2-oxohepta-3-ene-1,7-dioic acid hydratase in catechol pathway
MEIVRFMHEGQPRYGIVEGAAICLCEGEPFTGLKRTSRLLEMGSAKLLAPVSPPNILCLGLNYKRHADEAGVPYPPAPLLFLKPTTALCGPGDAIVLPESYEDSIDYEAELVIVIGKKTRDVPEDKAADFILGYTVGNDVSNRTAQFKDGQWARGKSHDTFCPIGPAIVTDLDADNLNIGCRLDGQVMQSSNTSNMIFTCRQIVSYLSRCMTLLPGTIILTGTPEGVGYARKPPVFLKAGQTVECTIEGIGTLANPVVRHGQPAAASAP